MGCLCTQPGNRRHPGETRPESGCAAGSRDSLCHGGIVGESKCLSLDLLKTSDSSAPSEVMAALPAPCLDPFRVMVALEVGSLSANDKSSSCEQIMRKSMVGSEQKSPKTDA